MGATISQASYPPFIFALIIGVPSLILYIVEVFVLVANASNFRSAFFRLFIARSVSIWHYLLPASILMTYLAPLSCTIQLLTYDFYVKLQNDNWTFTVGIDMKPDRTYIKSTYLSAWSASLFALICGVLNVITIVLYRKSKHSQVNLTMTKENKMESRLTIYAFITFMAQLSMAAYYILIYLASWLFYSDFHFFLSLANQLCWVYDITTIVLPAWLLLWASSNVRKRVHSLILPRSWRKTESTLFERKTQPTGRTAKTAPG
ncbi:serpentine type 7TM GPCR chemoreceptor srv domain-containing protein [Ditylenchus destructor]|nr:serpentine type 7TM GPCR chemoreceptor srv domain-containing protein [Ditylenchus destructor]